jgi:oligoribonuclease NrnB/cAMP/cGMP phosphodiesterase (DHH superfamily)
MRKEGRPCKYPKEEVDSIMRQRSCSRQYAYAVLRKLANPTDEFNVARFSAEECRALIRVCEQRLVQLEGGGDRVPAGVSDFAQRMMQTRKRLQAAKVALQADPMNSELAQAVIEAEEEKARVIKGEIR